MTEAKHWSLLSELYTLEAAVEGARMLVDADRAQDAHDARVAPAAAAAVLSLVTVRMRDLARVLCTDVDSEEFWAPHNASGPNADGRDAVFGSRSGSGRRRRSPRRTARS